MTRVWHTVTPGPPGGPTVVLVHGALDRSSSFARVQRQLTGCTVVRYDRRGYGRSVETGPPSGFEQQVDDLAEVLGAGGGAGHGVVVGHSYGALVSLGLAARADDRVGAVVAYEPPMPWAPWWPAASAGGAAMAGTDPGDAAERFMRRVVGDAVWERLPPSTRRQRRAEGPALLAELRSLRDRGGPPYDPGAVRLPVVVAHGSETSERHVRAATETAAGLPHAELEVVAGAGHGVHLSHPDALAALVERACALARAS